MQCRISSGRTHLVLADFSSRHVQTQFRLPHYSLPEYRPRRTFYMYQTGAYGPIQLCLGIMIGTIITSVEGTCQEGKAYHRTGGSQGKYQRRYPNCIARFPNWSRLSRRLNKACSSAEQAIGELPAAGVDGANRDIAWSAGLCRW